MARAIWTGSISFGLVTIPVRLLPAVRADEEVHFHYLHAKDEGRIRNVRQCEVDGQEVHWSEIVRGFEYEKGSYVVLRDDELAAIRAEVAPSVEILAFVDRSEIDPMLFDTPYHLEPEKRGRHAYALLRDVLERAHKVGIAKVVLRTRAHLAALRPAGRELVVELLRYPHEIITPGDLDLPPLKEKASAAEMKAAEMLVGAMTKRFEPGDYKDEYEEQLRAAIEERVRTLQTRGGKGAKGPKVAKPTAAKATNVVDLVEVLKRSLEKREKRPGAPAAGSAPARDRTAKRAGARRRA